MTARAAFHATYSDFRLIKTRKIIQIVCEVPLERANEVLRVLGGMPDPAAEKWCAIAVLNLNKAQQPVEDNDQPRPPLTPQSSPKAGGAKNHTGTKKPWHEMRSSQQAGLLCNDISFQRYIAELNNRLEPNKELTVNFVRNYCGVTSRSLINESDTARAKWNDLVSNYRGWMHPV